MPGWLAWLIEAVLGAFLTPRNASATSEAERAGAAESAVKANDQIMAKVEQAQGARRHSDAVQPTADGLPDDGWRRDE